MVPIIGWTEAYKRGLGKGTKSGKDIIRILGIKKTIKMTEIK